MKNAIFFQSVWEGVITKSSRTNVQEWFAPTSVNVWRTNCSKIYFFSIWTIGVSKTMKPKMTTLLHRRSDILISFSFCLDISKISLNIIYVYLWAKVGEISWRSSTGKKSYSFYQKFLCLIKCWIFFCHNIETWFDFWPQILILLCLPTSMYWNFNYCTFYRLCSFSK